MFDLSDHYMTIVWGIIMSLVLFIFPASLGPDRWNRLVKRIRELVPVKKISKKDRTKPPLFGERKRKTAPMLQDIPEFVLVPKFEMLPRLARGPLKAIWFILIVSPYLIYNSFKFVFKLFFGLMNYVGQQGRGVDIRPDVLFRHADIGRRSVAGGRKGGSSPERPAATAYRDNKIRAEAKDMMSTGKKFRDLASIFVTRYSNDPDYPNSKTQYRNILRPLKDELEIK